MLKAQHIAETIPHDIQHVNFNLAEDEADLIVTVSIGVAVGAKSWIDLLERADQALFKAKAAGRDRVSA